MGTISDISNLVTKLKDEVTDRKVSEKLNEIFSAIDVVRRDNIDMREENLEMKRVMVAENIKLKEEIGILKVKIERYKNQVINSEERIKTTNLTLDHVERKLEFANQQTKYIEMPLSPEHLNNNDIQKLNKIPSELDSNLQNMTKSDLFLSYKVALSRVDLSLALAMIRIILIEKRIDKVPKNQIISCIQEKFSFDQSFSEDLFNELVDREFLEHKVMDKYLITKKGYSFLGENT